MIYARNGMTMTEWRAYNLGRFLAVAERAEGGRYNFTDLIHDLTVIRDEFREMEVLTHTQLTDDALESTTMGKDREHLPSYPESPRRTTIDTKERTRRVYDEH